MVPEPDATGADSVAGDTARQTDDPTVLLFMGAGRDRELLVEALGDRYRVETTTDVQTLETTFDCCVFDVQQFNRVAGTVQERRDTAKPVFLPFVLLVGSDALDDATEAWEYVDDVVELPVEKKVLRSRIRNLVQRRRTALELAEREEQLERTIEDLRLKERAMDEAPVGITISEAAGRDNPLVYANERFETLTGYSSNVLGRDCRFLQGEDTDSETTATIRAAIDAQEPVSVDILNYRRNGQKFWNKLDVAPLRDDGTVTHFVGFQTEITERKIRERQLEVLNRVLTHNLRNKMNVIEGHADLLRREYEDEDPPSALATIERTTADMLRLSETVREVERTLTASESTGQVVNLNERLRQVVSALADRFPAATLDLSLPDGDPCEVDAVGVLVAIEEAVENAVKHNDAPEPTVEITVERRAGEWLDVEITDDGPGIPAKEIEVLSEGETPLRHADRLGIWLIYWVVSKAGGEFSVSEADDGGTTVSFSVPEHGGGSTGGSSA